MRQAPLHVFWIASLLMLIAVYGCHTQKESSQQESILATLPELVNTGFDSIQLDMLNRFVQLHREAKGKKVGYGQNKELIPAKDSVSFGEVAHIFYNNCRTCHRDNGTAPFAFNNYFDILRKAKTVKKALVSHIMPPWSAVSGHGEFSNAPDMTPEDIAKVLRWFNDGAACPDAQKQVLIDDLVPVKSYENLVPDLYISSGFDHTISRNADTYHCKVIDLNLKKDEFLRGLKPVSSNPKAVHHITIFLDTLGILGDNGENWDCLYGEMVHKLIPFDTWSKGFKFYAFDTNFHYRLPKNSKLMLQVHYDQHQQGQKEQTSIQLYRTDSLNQGRQIKWLITDNRDIHIPHDSVKVETIRHTVDHDISLLSVIPHMHYVGRMMEVYAIDTLGKRTDLLRIDDWDYAFQGRYMMKHPVKITKGSTIVSNVIYDNSLENPYQPNFPPIDVRYELGGKQEMMVLTYYYVDYQPGDEEKTIGNVAI